MKTLFMLKYFLILMFPLGLLGGCTEPQKPSLPPIGIQQTDGQSFFTVKGTSKQFYPVGFNYIRLRFGDHSTFEAKTQAGPADYDPARAEKALQDMSVRGYNTVRVFLIGRREENPGIAGSKEGSLKLYAPYLNNFIDFLRIAQEQQIYVIPAFGDGELPISQAYQEKVSHLPEGKNKLYLTKAGIDAKKAYYRHFFQYIKQKAPNLLPVMLGVELQNEYCLSAIEWPFSEVEGDFKAANGKIYDLSDTLSRQALFEEMSVYYLNEMTATIKSVVPDILVGESVFVNRAVGKANPKDFLGLFPHDSLADWQERYPPNLDLLAKTDLDFIDLHFYKTRHEPIDRAFKKDLASAAFFEAETEGLLATKPMILGEFGAFMGTDTTEVMATETMVGTLKAMQKYPFSGWLIWTYDCHEQEGLWNAQKLGEPLFEKLKNFQQP